MSTCAIQILSSHFDKNGWPRDLCYKKYIDRARQLENADLEHCAIVEITRHKAILGCTYTPGFPMSAFEEYFMRYKVNLETEEVECLEDQFFLFSVDIENVVEEDLSKESFSPALECSPNGYLIKDSVSNEEKFVNSLKEVEDFLKDYLDQSSDYFFDRLREYEKMTTDQRNEFHKKYVSTMGQVLKEKARHLWGTRDK